MTLSLPDLLPDSSPWSAYGNNKEASRSSALLAPLELWFCHIESIGFTITWQWLLASKGPSQFNLSGVFFPPAPLCCSQVVMFPGSQATNQMSDCHHSLAAG